MKILLMELNLISPVMLPSKVVVPDHCVMLCGFLLLNLSLPVQLHQVGTIAMDRSKPQDDWECGILGNKHVLR